MRYVVHVLYVRCCLIFVVLSFMYVVRRVVSGVYCLLRTMLYMCCALCFMYYVVYVVCYVLCDMCYVLCVVCCAPCFP